MTSNEIPAVSPASVNDRAASIEATIRESLGVIRPSAIGLEGDADLAQAADLDSAEVMDLIMEIEDRLDLSIPVETVAQARTINELCVGILQLRHSIP